MRALVVVVLLFALAAGGAFPAPPPEVRRGPDPVALPTGTGPHAVDVLSVDRAEVAGFGGGVVYYPAGAADGPFGVLAVAPGYGENSATLAWWGPALASQGFVVVLIDTLLPTDFPDARATELLAALDWVVGDSPVRGLADPDRTAVLGHSMGGGGALEAALARPWLRAAVPMTPWDVTADFSAVRVPTLVVGAEGDTIAPAARYARPSYDSLTAVARSYLLRAGADHNFVNTPDPVVGPVVAWLKRYVDGDTRYTRFLCPDAAVPGYARSAGGCRVS
ncbi:alpha/beta hydrolase family protein [Actinokineospora bangkokensis]|uniref:alpha/beta hydrolase family protein n=1 Tax=Actinokineospora bangkokensis TaxID=1193682 RepID=UPI001178A68C|nr:alpha/beta hydrolase [Actinokineospora bangkokensis]